MLTPRFKISQDENHVYVKIHAPYTNVRDTEVDVDGRNLLFVSSPYFLRLQLPGDIVENESSKGSYTCDSGEFNFTFDKVNAGEHFENLDMITNLLAPRDIPNINPSLVEVLEEDGITLENDVEEDNANKYTYGFANKITTEFSSIGTEFPQIFELKTPENISVSERHHLRIQHEDHKFSSDHYLADLFDTELLEPYLNTIIFWNTPEFNKNIEFNDEEIGILKELPNKHYLLTQTEYKQVLYGLVDILYGFCYDKITTMNESTVESSWTINKLSATLSWFCTFKDTKQVLVACYRRALIHPMLRNFDLCIKVKNDLIALFRKGKKFIIKCMIEIHQMFNTSNDARYILNQLYIKDYLVFLQKCRNEELQELGNNIANTEITKKDLQLDLDEFEAAAELVQQDESDIVENEMALKMASMSLLPERGARLVFNNDLFDSSDSSSDSDSDSSSDSDSTTDDSSEYTSNLDSDDDHS